jgi:hypothetical protein
MALKCDHKVKKNRFLASFSLFSLLSVLLCLSLVCRAQELPLGIPPEIVPSTPRQGPLFWADGITQEKDLDAYQAIGFNVVVVRLSWNTNAGGEISALDLAPQRAFAEAAARRGLKIIYALPAAPVGLEGSFRLAADSDAYVALWTTWLQDAITSLRGTTNLIGCCQTTRAACPCLTILVSNAGSARTMPMPM